MMPCPHPALCVCPGIPPLFPVAQPGLQPGPEHIRPSPSGSCKVFPADPTGAPGWHVAKSTQNIMTCAWLAEGLVFVWPQKFKNKTKPKTLKSKHPTPSLEGMRGWRGKEVKVKILFFLFQKKKKKTMQTSGAELWLGCVQWGRGEGWLATGPHGLRAGPGRLGEEGQGTTSSFLLSHLGPGKGFNL